VQSVTTAQRGLSDDLATRTRRYLLMMGTRTVCFGLAIVVDHWSRWVFAFLAVVLPYFGVVGANAGRERTRDTMPTPAGPPRTALVAAVVPERPQATGVGGWTPDRGSDRILRSRVP
jgi:hypothetical protein